MQHLAAQQGVTQVLLMGHSTGCQDAVRYVQRYGSQDTQQQQGRRLPQLVGVVLQAPVSARGDGHFWQLWDGEGDKAGPRRRTASAHFSTEWLPCRTIITSAPTPLALSQFTPWPAPYLEGSGCLTDCRCSALQVSDSEWLGMYADQLDPLVPEADRLVAAGQGQQILTRCACLLVLPAHCMTGYGRSVLCASGRCQASSSSGSAGAKDLRQQQRQQQRQHAWRWRGAPCGPITIKHLTSSVLRADHVRSAGWTHQGAAELNDCLGGPVSNSNRVQTQAGGCNHSALCTFVLCHDV